MHCTDCGWEYPYDTAFNKADCVGCGASITPTAEEFLEFPELGIAKECRPDQIKLTKLLHDVYKNQEIAIIEAGTGIGKSFAYLIPAILDRVPVVVSTAKKALQVQLYEKDLPFLRETLGVPFSSMILYGKSNYVCKDKVMKEDHPYFSKEVAKHFFDKTESGLWEETEEIFRNKKHLKVLKHGIPELSVDKCTGHVCKHYNTCPYIAERRKVPKTDVIITNHWLVGYDFRISSEDSNATLLPRTGTRLVVDEAHKFEEAVRQAFTTEMNEASLFVHYKNLNKITNEEPKDIAPLLEDVERDWKAFFTTIRARSGQYLLTDATAAKTLAQTMGTALQQLQRQTVIDNYMSACLQNGEASITGAGGALLKALNNFGVNRHNSNAPALSPLMATPAFDVYFYLYNFLYDTAELLTGFADKKSNTVHYADCTNKVATIKSAPLSVAPILKPYYDCRSSGAKYSSISYLSATLAVNKNFTNFAYRTGVSLSSGSVQQANYPTAFNYDTQAVFYVGSHLPAPEQSSLPAYRQALVTEIAELVNACQGNAFVLFTAREDLEYVTGNITELLDASVTLVSQLAYPTSAQAALKKFISTHKSALFGMKSFWEGVDIPGDKLQLVIITKLPFPNSKDPIISARSEAAGDRAFVDVIIPEMISDLRQGVGRLIRSKTDRGVVALLDSRAVNKSYKNTILNSLGVTKILTDKARVIRNLEYLASQRV